MNPCVLTQYDFRQYDLISILIDIVLTVEFCFTSDFQYCWLVFFCIITNNVSSCYIQELRPKGMDVRQDELGDLVDKEMAATSAAIDEAVRRIDVSGGKLFFDMY